MPMKPSTTWPGWNVCGNELLGLVALLELGELLLGLAEAAAALFLLFFEAADVHVPFEVFRAAVDADGFVLVLAESNEPSAAKYCAFSGTRISDFGVHAFGQRELALLPNLGDVVLPALLHAA